MQATLQFGEIIVDLKVIPPEKELIGVFRAEDVSVEDLDRWKREKGVEIWPEEGMVVLIRVP